MRVLPPRTPAPVTLLAVAWAIAGTVAVGGCGGAGGTARPAADGTAAAAPDADAPSPWMGRRAAGVTDPALAGILRAHWAWLMADRPLFATRLGDHRYDDRIFDRSQAAWAARRERMEAFRQALDGIDPDALGPEDRVHRQLLLGELAGELGSAVCRFEEWNVSARSNAVGRWNVLPELHPVPAAEDGERYLTRLAQAPEDIARDVESLRRGLEAGRVATAESLRRTLALVRGQLDAPLESWAVLEPSGEPRPGWSPEARQRFDARLREIVEGDLRPAYAAYAAFLEDEALPQGRPEGRDGLGSLPDGDACYRAMIRKTLGVERTPAALHALGQREIAVTDQAIRELGEQLFGTADLAGTLERLRTDPALAFDSREAVEAKAAAALDAAQRAVPAVFGRLPETPCVVRPVPDYEAPFTTIAYYRPPNPDGSRPGTYFVNSWKPEVRPRYGMEALTFHESVPGHHLQIALAQELADLPLFRKHLGTTAFVEGWALYSERLADELGLYSGDLDRLGMHGYQAWRAARLVVDTGLHAMGWTREQAVTFMLEHTALAEDNVRNEVDRYLGTPGQALAYKVGQLEIEALRREAEAALGDRFELAGFHDAVLGGGAVSLPVLRDRVGAWIAAGEPAGSAR